MVVQALAAEARVPITRRVGSATVGLGLVEASPVILAIPKTFMNESGQAITALLARWPVPRERLLVICDDVALPLGMVRIRPGGSDGGHRGLRSIIDALESSAVPRLRIGIKSGTPPKALEAYVLAPFAPAERRQLPVVLEAAMTACRVWIRQGMGAAMNQSNRKVQSER